MSEPKAVMKSWVELVTGLTVIYDGDPEPSAPSPLVDSATFTYAAINFTTDESPLATAYEVLTDTAGTTDPTKFDQIRSLQRRGELDVALYGPGADDYCRALELSMGRNDVQLLLDAAGDFALNTPSVVSDEPILRSATREPAASIQFTVSWIETETFELEAVATIDTTIDVDEES